MNCEASLAAEQRFCGARGQRTTPRRLTIGQMASLYTIYVTH